MRIDTLPLHVSTRIGPPPLMFPLLLLFLLLLLPFYLPFLPSFSLLLLLDTSEKTLRRRSNTFWILQAANTHDEKPNFTGRTNRNRTVCLFAALIFPEV